MIPRILGISVEIKNKIAFSKKIALAPHLITIDLF